jgi:hypothetical protein
MHEWSRLKKENAHLYDYNRQVNRGWRGFVLRLMGIHLPDNDRVRLQGINARKNPSVPTEASPAVVVNLPFSYLHLWRLPPFCDLRNRLAHHEAVWKSPGGRSGYRCAG